MFCSNCGKKVKESAEFCDHCGKPVKPGVVAGAVAVKEKPGSVLWILLAALMVAGIVWGIVAVVGVVSDEFNKYANTFYPVFCRDWVKGGRYNPPTETDFAHCLEPQALDRQVYQVTDDGLRVIESSPDNARFFQLTDCTIVDAQTWKCEDDASLVGSRSMSDGKFIAYGLTAILFVTEPEWASINNGAPSPQQ